MKRLLLFVSSLLFALALSEFALRVLGYRPRVIDPEMFQSHDDALLPYKLRPNYEGYYVGGKVHIDADGNRVVLPQCHGKLALILGDSVAFGQGLNDDETISSQLQKQLCGQYKIRNIAAPGYSSWNEYAAFRDYQEPLNRLILIYVPNDVTYENNHLKITENQIADLSNSRTHQLLRTLYSHVYVSFLLADGLKNLKHRDSVDAVNLSILDYSMQAIELIRELCRKRNIEFSVAIYRDLWYYTQPEESAQYENAVSTKLSKLGINNFVLKSHIQQLKLSEARVHFNDPHPSRRAVELIVSDLKTHFEP